MTTKKKTLLDRLEEAIGDENTDAEKLNSLYELYDRQRDREAQIEFNGALRQVQKKVAYVAADAENKQTKSNYATYQKLDQALRPHYTEAGFSVSFDTADAPADHVRVLAELAHEGGHCKTFHVDIPVVTTGISGNANMTRTHAVASAQSYGMRYLLKLMFNVAIGEHDDDGNAAGQQPISAKQYHELVDLQDRCFGDDEGGMDKFFSWMKKDLKVEELSELNQNGYGRVKEMLERKLKSKEAA